MISKQRLIAINLIKSWAQGHDNSWIIADEKSNTNETLENTADNLIKAINVEKKLRLDLVKLVDRLENILSNKTRSEFVDGCKCIKCSIFFDFAAPNNDGDTFICFSCRK